MFNQRPTSLLGLEPRQDGGELLSFLSPMITTPDEYIKYFDYFLARERLTDPSLPATTPNSLEPNPTINQFHQHQQQQQQLQHHHQQQQQQQHHHLAQQILPQQPIPTSQQVDPLQYHQQSLLQHLPGQQVSSHQSHQLPPRAQQGPTSAQNLEANSDAKQEFISLNATQEVHQTQAQSQPQIIKESCQNQATLTNNLLDRAKLSEEEKIRNKRERNRRAAANCRRRKDEKLKQLSEENMELRKTIDNLQSIIISLQARLSPGNGST